MKLSTNQSVTLIVPSEKDGERFSKGKTLSGFYMGDMEIKLKKEKVTDPDEYKTVYKFKSTGTDGFREGDEFGVFSTGLLKYQMEKGIHQLVQRAGLTLPKFPYITLINEGKQKNKQYYTWKIEVELDLDMKIEDYFGFTDAPDIDVHDGVEPGEANNDNWESSNSEDDNAEF